MPKEKNINYRPDWDKYFMAMAFLVATRSTCLRRKVGAVLVKNRRILSTGYNGAPSGFPHCEDNGCLREKLQIPSGERQEICWGIHAEQNAVIQAAIFGVSTAGSILYCTTKPCITCAKILANAGVEKVFAAEDYPDEFSDKLLKELDIPLIYMSKPDMSFLIDMLEEIE